MTTEDYILISRLKGIAVNRCKIIEDVEDVMQDVFLRILMRQDFESMTENEKTGFAICLIVNRCTDYYRMRNRRGGIPLECDKVSLKVNPDVYGKMELKEVMRKATGNRNCESLFKFIDGYHIKEIAEMTGQKLNTILARCRYAKKYLRA